MTLSRELEAAARKFADRQTDRLAEIPADIHFKANVTTVTPGAAKDGNALVRVTWRGRSLIVNDYPDSYTPVVGHRVRCVLDTDNELGILHHCIGSP